ncbi:39S ribosomal protein L19, mitochondrial-like [Patiria miniata]|uniref:Large ribosomal subunit protein bL19m n=1 Tax=Patiria miniata TaxID=46514 RepID=A0A913ZBX0_PATMI|nr:39S ribosomal protein L19, mitochondrial-like [Patiria miniata]
MALRGCFPARLPCLIQRCLVSKDLKCQVCTTADTITVAETTADKREKHVHDQDGSSPREIRERFISPELLPPMGTRSKLLDYLERKDCFRRRKVLHIPEFYVGSIMAVTVADSFAKGKSNRFVGICTRRGGVGLGATFVLRNVINDQGVDICYELYSPLIQKIEVLKLEKRLDADLKYLQDALPEYSTIDPNMVPIKHPPNRAIPVNPIKVQMKPKPWYKRWEREELQGVDFSILSEEKLEHAKQWWLPDYKRMDLLQHWELPENIRSGIEREVEQHESELSYEKSKR